jgi:hypothetical protein
MNLYEIARQAAVELKLNPDLIAHNKAAEAMQVPPAKERMAIEGYKKIISSSGKPTMTQVIRLFADIFASDKN